MNVQKLQIVIVLAAKVAAVRRLFHFVRGLTKI
jgi:hypothetical protein